MAGDKINTQNLVVFIYVNSISEERELSKEYVSNYNHMKKELNPENKPNEDGEGLV